MKSNRIIKGRGTKATAGLTLVELLIAIALSSVVVSAAGFGLVTMMESNKDLETKTVRRIELNRAIEYISEDIRMANRIEAIPVGSTLPSGATGIFMLTLPDDNPDDTVLTPTNIVYFIKASTTTWLPPYTIYRAKNDYSGGVSIVDLTATGVSELVDAIAAPTASPTCSSGTLAGANGFYACIGSDNRTVDLYLYGKLIQSSEILPVNSKVVTRSNS
jgi:prepilin-type N-terminal cleavage/methylation domain-containing protein